MKNLALLIISILIWGTSCTRNPQQEVEEPVILDPPKSGDVYVAGTVGGKAVLWKNGVTHYLSDETHEAAALSVFVTANDVYVAGKVGCSAVLWKNGAAQNLSDEGGANSVFVLCSDVFVAGRIDSKAVLWKNGVAQYLTDGETEAEAKSVFVSGNDVYVVGNKLWKNGEVQKLTDGTDHPGGSSVFVSGSDVYVVGTEYQQDFHIATVWKNGVAQHLTNVSSMFITQWTSSIFVSGSDVYVTGIVHNNLSRMSIRYAKLWKNGEDISDTCEIIEATLNSVYVTGNDVYLAGRQLGQGPAVWKNGKPQYLPTDGNDNSIANSVFVVE